MVNAVKDKMSTGDFQLLFWLVSSHGGTDHFGEYFLDTNYERL